MTGSITAFMDLVGERPLRISDYDKAVLAIHDGEAQRSSTVAIGSVSGMTAAKGSGMRISLGS